jgi:hypothetical protein
MSTSGSVRPALSYTAATRSVSELPSSARMTRVPPWCAPSLPSWPESTPTVPGPIAASDPEIIAGFTLTPSAGRPMAPASARCPFTRACLP